MITHITFKKGNEWTTEEIRYVADHINTDSTEDIADHLGRTHQAVLTICGTYGIRKRFYSDEQAEQLRVMAARGVARHLIAKELGWTPTRTQRIMDELGITIYKPNKK